MEESKKIAKRIHNRKNQKQRIGLKILNRLLACICLLLAFLIYAYKDPNASLINSIFHTNLDLSSVNQSVMKFANSLHSFLNIKITSSNIQEVNGTIKFIPLGENRYTNDDSKVYSIGKGTIIAITEKEDGYAITLNLESGHVAYYENLEYVSIKKYDCVDEYTTIGFFIDEFKLTISKDGNYYTYEEIRTTH